MATRGWQGRGGMVVRQWRLLVLLRRRPMTIAQLADQCGASRRTVQRDLSMLEAVPFPIAQTAHNKHQRSTWSLMATPEWPRHEPTPIQELLA